ncbi:unnamed protein product, partial [Prorocentrum cordatum]
LARELEGAEASHARLCAEMDSVSAGTRAASEQAREFERRARDAAAREEELGAEEGRQREERAAVGAGLARAGRRVEAAEGCLDEAGVPAGGHALAAVHLPRWQAPDEERCRCHGVEGLCREQAQQNALLKEELAALGAELESARRGCAHRQGALQEAQAEQRRALEALRAGRQQLQTEREDAERGEARLGRLRAELVAADGWRRGAEADAAAVQAQVRELEDRCAAQRGWQEELLQRQGSTEAALERLRKELRGLGLDRGRLQKELDDVVRDRTRLEVEMESAVPGLSERWRRCRALEDRLAARALELDAEAEKTRRCRAEQRAAQARLSALELRAGRPPAEALPEPALERPGRHSPGRSWSPPPLGRSCPEGRSSRPPSRASSPAPAAGLEPPPPAPPPCAARRRPWSP